MRSNSSRSAISALRRTASRSSGKRSSISSAESSTLSWLPRRSRSEPSSEVRFLIATRTSWSAVGCGGARARRRSRPCGRRASQRGRGERRSGARRRARTAAGARRRIGRGRRRAQGRLRRSRRARRGRGERSRRGRRGHRSARATAAGRGLAAQALCTTNGSKPGEPPGSRTPPLVSLSRTGGFAASRPGGLVCACAAVRSRQRFE